MPSRDMDLIRRILATVEDARYTMGEVELEFDEYADDVVAYHVLLLHEADLLEAVDFSTMGGPAWRPVRLTWEGHEFLEASRDDTRWEKAKQLMTQHGGGMSFEVMKVLLVTLMKSAVLPSG